MNRSLGRNLLNSSSKNFLGDKNSTISQSGDEDENQNGVRFRFKLTENLGRGRVKSYIPSLKKMSNLKGILRSKRKLGGLKRVESISIRDNARSRTKLSVKTKGIGIIYRKCQNILFLVFMKRF